MAEINHVPTHFPDKIRVFLEVFDFQKGIIDLLNKENSDFVRATMPKTEQTIGEVSNFPLLGD